ncbi:EAL domain-containing protein [Sphingomonas sp. BN140010]|uniref:EAL domain-containing protein n=1 Tax=Sphingomonas arvum TaxID=2992113 RepID=A0ABT3JE49_9SPHN|nr:EAL domain-containing protein [Sphingomonas sp. BN140010]MCW3797352.1 EAL domain-containing protein [Sphingomonas sp. BN140010]
MVASCTFPRRGKRSSDRLAAPLPPLPDKALEEAMAGDDLGLHFQPQFDVRSGAVIGVEALARWPGVASPEELFARADCASLSERLSRTMQRKALQAAGRWTGDLASLKLSVNVLAEDLARPGYECWLLDEITAAKVDPQRITAEIIESSLVADPIAAAGRLARLRAAGVRIAVDDFGTGYASLAYLTTLPLDLIKIDRALIRDVVGGTRDRIVVRALIAMARELGLQVLVEGVEDPAQLALLQDWGCDYYQGFLGAQALDEEALARFVSAARSGPSAPPAKDRA